MVITLLQHIAEMSTVFCCQQTAKLPLIVEDVNVAETPCNKARRCFAAKFPEMLQHRGGRYLDSIVLWTMWCRPASFWQENYVTTRLLAHSLYGRSDPRPKVDGSNLVVSTTLTGRLSSSVASCFCSSCCCWLPGVPATIATNQLMWLPTSSLSILPRSPPVKTK